MAKVEGATTPMANNVQIRLGIPKAKNYVFC